jgi:signal transduction histidine kinase
VTRHANADSVSVVVRRRKGELVVLIEDNGLGFDPREPTDRFGLVAMRERLLLVAGALETESAPGKGTSLRATIPLAH